MTTQRSPAAETATALGLPRAPETRIERTIDFGRRLFAVRLALPSFLFLMLVVFAALAAPWIAPHNPTQQDPFNGLLGPSREFLLGTDQLGRDILSRVIFGSRVALMVGFGAIGFGIIVGMPLGIISGYARGWVDEVIMRAMDALIAFPGLVLALALVAVRGASLFNLILAIGVFNIPFIARIVRGQVLSVREHEYVVGARALGATPLRIMTYHVLPNILAPVIVTSTLAMGYAILAEAALSFLGLGIPPPTPTWGRDLQFAFNFLSIAPLLSIVPGMAIFLLVLSLNLLGDALRDVLDPRLRGVT